MAISNLEKGYLEKKLVFNPQTAALLSNIYCVSQFDLPGNCEYHKLALMHAVLFFFLKCIPKYLSLYSLFIFSSPRRSFCIAYLLI